MQRQDTQTTMDVDEAKDENLKKIVDSVVAGVPEEFLLGSITTSAVAKEERCMQIRSSARVFKKMKLEQEQDKKHEDSSDPSLTSPNSDHPTSVGPAEKSTEHEGKGQPVRSSTRVVNKKIKQDLSQSTTVTETSSKGNKTEVKRDIKKEARIWSYEDKVLFFEAINEFGKDFENIQQYINSKLKKKGVLEEQMRTKEHVRYFYSKTFHEISKHVKFSDGIKKVVQELYGIINYGELYKKVRGISDKAFIKLNELIYRGATCVRVKGQNKRVKTPMCRALIKLNQLDEKYEEVKLPNRVTVELRPKDMTSYVKVQCLAQNPRVRTTLPIQKRLNALIQCLNKRWKTVEVSTYEKSAISTNPITNDCVPLKEAVEEKVKLVTSALKLSPPSEAKIDLPSINISEYLTRQTICLTAYESRLGLDTYSEIKEMMSKKKKPKLLLDVTEPKVESCDTTTLKIEPKKEEENEATNYYENEPDSLLADAAHDAINTILSLQNFDRQHSETSEPEDLPLKTDIKTEHVQKTELLKVTEEDLEHIESIKRGWTEATSESLTVGEIYLMYGSDAKLILEYSWGTDGEELERPKKSAANFLEMWNDSYEESWELRQKNLTSSLSKLLSLAKLNYRETAVKCRCGHVCNEKPVKNTSLGNSRVRRNMIDTNGSTNSNKAEDNSSANAVSEMKNEKSEATSGLFRTPMHILSNGPNNQAPTVQQQLNSIQKLKPKFTNRKGRRFRQKPIVVERKLPLLPNNLSGHQIVRMSIKSQETPIIPVAETKLEPEQDFDLQKVIDPEDEHSNISTVPSSPSKILQEGENEWMNAEVGDYSLSSLLGHLEGPAKPPVAMASEISNEVDAQLRCLMTESSMDFAASFADLAESVASTSDRKF
ncbi:unnamed protein product [Ceutorhynchus assimilis]|uniref:Protein cramped n=1 Tax=Ceutorhynchus assimilis TaxID=467358 RepID=A0A9N9MEC4_9CUCU|nr:unnamed protein product [Ceutorhynchus assimilis]